MSAWLVARGNKIQFYKLKWGKSKMNFVKKNGAGLLLCLVIAVPSWFLGQAVPVIGGPVFAILIGMILTLILTKKEPFMPGVNYTSKKILQEPDRDPCQRETVSSYYNIYDRHIADHLLHSVQSTETAYKQCNPRRSRILYLRRQRHCSNRAGDRRI